MRGLEKFCIRIRHSPWLERADWLWDRLRPWYDQAVARLGHNGLERIINGTDRILILPKFRGVGETYEPEVWSHLMAQVRAGDIVADVGVFLL